jgi:Flp pilus assembly protein TadG
MKRVRDDSGAATLEFGVLLPLLLLLLVAAVPVIKAGWEFMILDRAVAHGVRYASRVDVNARSFSGGLTRRPTAAEVQTFVQQAASPLAPSSVTVSPDPTSAMPGERITVAATHEITLGGIADVANGVSTLLLGRGGIFPKELTVTVSASGREE